MRRLWTLSCVALLLTILAMPVARAGGPSGCGDSGLLAARTNQQTIDVIDADGTRQWSVAETGSDVVLGEWATEPTWAPGGDALAYGHNSGALYASTMSQLRIVSVNGGRAESVASIPVAGMITEAAWAPDGTRVAFVHWARNYPVELATWTPVGDEGSLMVVNRDGSGLRVVAVGTGVINDLAWAPNGRSLAFANGWLPSRVEIVDVDAVPALVRSASALDLNASSPVWSPDGSRLAYIANPVERLLDPPHIWVGDTFGRTPRKLPLSTWDRPTWSPDSRWVAAGNADRNAPGIVAVRVADKQVRPMTDLRYDRAAAWSPDGTRLAFTRQVDQLDAGSIWTIDVSSGAARPVSAAIGYGTPVWCPA